MWNRKRSIIFNELKYFAVAVLALGGLNSCSVSLIGVHANKVVKSNGPPPATPTVLLTDGNTGNTTHTNHATNNIAITADTGAVKWCVLEAAAAAAAPSAPLPNDACFTSPRPTTYALTGRGNRKVYVYTLSAGNVVSTAAGIATFDFPLPSVINATGPATASQSACSGPMTISLQDSYGLASPADVNNAISLTGIGTGNYYSDSLCSGSITTAFAAGDTTKDVYFKTSSLGALTLTAGGYSTTGTVSVTVSPVYMISMGYNQSVCSIVAGSVQCWGFTGQSEAGDGIANNQLFRYASTQASGISSAATSVSAGRFHTCAVVDGAAKCWGANFVGEVGDGTTSPRATPVSVAGLGSGVRQIGAGDSFSCAIHGDALKCWGDNVYGKLGNGTTGGSNVVPTTVPGLSSGVTAVSVGLSSTCAIKAGALKCWGYGYLGRLGDGNATDSNTPVDPVGMGSGVTAVSVGTGTACAIKSGALYCWGDNSTGAVGDGTNTQRNAPVPVPGFGAGVTAVSVSPQGFACAIKAGNTYCWGQNDRGQLGTGALSSTGATSPQAVGSLAGTALSLATGSYTACAVITGNQFRCWGQDGVGETGDARAAPIPVPVPADAFAATASKIVVGPYTSCSIYTDNSLWCRGAAGPGVGDGSGVSKTAPVQVFAAGVTSVSIGNQYSCAVVSGAVKCWGGGFGLTPVTKIAAGATIVSVSSTSDHACAVVSGGIQCWGSNWFGQLGNGTNRNSNSTPAYVTGIGSGAGATDVAVGDTHSCAIVGGAMKCWGDNTNSRLGDGTVAAEQDTPVSVVNATSGVTSISLGTSFSCAVITNSAYCWGANYSGNQGITAWQTTPVTPVSTLPASVSKVSASSAGNLACATLTTGVVYCWGDNNYGQLGNGLFTTDYGGFGVHAYRVTSLLSGGTDVSSNGYTTCAVVSGTVKCWGSNEYAGLARSGVDLYSTALQTPVLYGTPAQLSISGPATSTNGSCSGLFTVSLQDITGASKNSVGATTVTLANGGTGAFYTDVTCTGSTTTTISIANGTSSATFYYKAPSIQEVGITASSPNLIPGGIKHNAN